MFTWKTVVRQRTPNVINKDFSEMSQADINKYTRNFFPLVPYSLITFFLFTYDFCKKCLIKKCYI